MTRVIRGWASGDASRDMTAEPPADWPAMVTVVGSPPNAAMLSRTHSRPRIMSRRPRFVGASEIHPKPSKPRRYERATVTMPSRLKERPSYQGLDDDPAKKPPPWIQTRTGSLASRLGAGVNTLTLRVSFPGKQGSGIVVTGPNGRRCGVAPGAEASRMPSQGRAGCGAANRSSPMGAWAYGMP